MDEIAPVVNGAWGKIRLVQGGADWVRYGVWDRAKSRVATNWSRIAFAGEKVWPSRLVCGFLGVGGSFRHHMNAVTQILQAAENGEAEANVTEKLLPLIYDELRRLAAHQMAGERPGQTLQATALVHEAYVRIVGNEERSLQHWESRGHFFAAAAEAMRRILIDRARQKQSLKRGGDHARTTWEESKAAAAAAAPNEILAVDEALTKLNEEDPDLAKLVKLRYFVGLTVPETAAALGVSPSTIDRQWACARAWLFREITEGK